MSETLFDQEVICGFMEPVVGFRGCDFPRSLKGWWTAELGQPKQPRELTLNECHAVEERLTDEQWDAYEELFDSVILWGRERSLLHASAEQKIRALAAVLRKEEPQ